MKAVGGGAGRRSAPKWRRWGGYLAAAACLAVAIGLGSRLFLPEAVEMGVLDAASLPETTLTQRGDAAEEDVEDFLAENGVALEALTPGYAMETVRLESGANAQGERRRMATAVYAGEDGSLTVTVADFETILYQAMADMPCHESGNGRCPLCARRGAGRDLCRLAGGRGIPYRLYRGTHAGGVCRAGGGDTGEMNHMRRAIVVFAALLALTLLPARAEADYAHTVLVYMIGADLQESGYAAEDLEEMLDADIGADTCVLLLAGGAPEAFAHLARFRGGQHRLPPRGRGVHARDHAARGGR